MITTIPFSGFYESLHNTMLDDALEGLHMGDSGDFNSDLCWKSYNLVNWQGVMLAYARDYAERFALEFSIQLEFESLDSPREYNFTTDRIFCTIEEREVRRIYDATDKQTLNDSVEEKFTSRDGFSSFYSNDLEEWGDVATWDHNQVGTLLECYANQETINSDGYNSYAEYSLMDDARGNGEIENWLYENVKDEETFERYIKISRYLADRKQR